MKKYLIVVSASFWITGGAALAQEGGCTGPPGEVKLYVEVQGVRASEGLIAVTLYADVASKFLAKRGPGLHHVAYAVGDIEQALAEARAAGVELIDAEPRIGLNGRRIAFLHPKSMGGVLTELVEA